MSRFRTLINQSFPDEVIPDDWMATFRGAEATRKTLVFKIQHDIVVAAETLGQTDAQADAKVDTLFSTFASEWSIYILTGATAIITAIQNDASIAWLDTDVAGTSIRQRLINRLS